MMRVYSVFDGAVQMYMQPFYLRSDGEAIRAMLECMSSPNHQFAKYPGDYSLFYLGVFLENRGLFVYEDGEERAPRLIGNLLSLSKDRASVDASTVGE